MNAQKIPYSEKKNKRINLPALVKLKPEGVFIEKIKFFICLFVDCISCPDIENLVFNDSRW